MYPILATLSEWHIILALVIVFLLFGGRKLPELARGVGEAIREFKKSQRDLSMDTSRPTPPPVTTPPAAVTPGVPLPPPSQEATPVEREPPASTESSPKVG